MVTRTGVLIITVNEMRKPANDERFCPNNEEWRWDAITEDNGTCNRENYTTESVVEYWKWTLAIPFLDAMCYEMKFRFNEGKRAYFEQRSHSRGNCH